LDRSLGEHQSRAGHGGEEKYSQPLPGLEPSIIQPVAQCYAIELSPLLKNPSRLFLFLEIEKSDTGPSQVNRVAVPTLLSVSWLKIALPKEPSGKVHCRESKFICPTKHFALLCERKPSKP
jgi:hypothetical protein